MAAYTGKIEIGELNRQVVMTTYETAVSSPETQTIWVKVLGYLDLPYWSSSSLGFILRLPANLETDYWRGWYITWGGLNYYFYQFQIIDDTATRQQFVFVEGRSTSFVEGELTIGDYGTYNSDALAAAGGLAIGDPYWAGLGHDRVSGVLTKRLE